MDSEDYTKYIGRFVAKTKSNKPFKSGSYINCIAGIINHPILNIPAFTFIDDDSYVECIKCFLVFKEDI
jgi:hypothetical protein